MRFIRRDCSLLKSSSIFKMLNKEIQLLFAKTLVLTDSLRQCINLKIRSLITR